MTQCDYCSKEYDPALIEETAQEAYPRTCLRCIQDWVDHYNALFPDEWNPRGAFWDDEIRNCWKESRETEFA